MEVFPDDIKYTFMKRLTKRKNSVGFPAGAIQPRQPQMPPPQQQQPQVRHWYDKLVDALIGEEGPETKYALICRHCFAHNGLVLPQEIEHIRKFL